MNHQTFPLKMKILQYAVIYATYGATFNVIIYLLKPTKNCKMMMYLLDNALFVSEISLLTLKNKETKNASLFRYFRTNTKPQTNPNNELINLITSEKKISQINQLHGHNKNTISWDFYDLNELKKVIVTKQDLAALHFNICSEFPHY